MRPQLGSAPKKARLDERRVADGARHGGRPRSSSQAPPTVRRTVWVEPSPSPTRATASASMAASSAASKTVSAGPVTATPEAPLARQRTMSLVDCWPSTVTLLKVRATTRRSRSSSAGCGMAASVVTKHSVVAMRGEIMPAPLAARPMRTSAAVEVHGERAGLGGAVGGADGGGEVGAAVGRERLGRRRRCRSRWARSAAARRSRRSRPRRPLRGAAAGRRRRHGACAPRRRARACRCRRWRCQR